MSLTRHLVLIVIDGLRPDALQQAQTPVLDALVAVGANTYRARTVVPSVTLPCHNSMFRSLPPEAHGVMSNDWPPPLPTVPSIVEVVHQAQQGTAVFHSWDHLRYLFHPDAADFVHYHRLSDPLTTEPEIGIAVAAATYITAQRPAFSFVYLETVDAVGHLCGWMSEPYLRAVQRSDMAIGILVDALRVAGMLPDVTFLILGDHGGHDKRHGSALYEDVTIPWLLSGKGIRRGHTIATGVSILDTAPTVARLLGLPIPAAWRGKVVAEALNGG